MAIEKMSFLRIAGSVEDMHDILKKLVLSEKLHIDLENTAAFDNSFIIHEYESVMAGSLVCTLEDTESVEAMCTQMEESLEHLGDSLDIVPKLDKSSIGDDYDIADARDDLNRLKNNLGESIGAINEKKNYISRYEQFKEKVKGIKYKNLHIDRIAELNYFDYEIGTLSSENRLRLKKNYENISAVVLEIGTVKNSTEDMFIIIFPKKFRGETENLLKSLSWVRLDIPEGMNSSVSDMVERLDSRIQTLRNEIDELSGMISGCKDQTVCLMNRIHTMIVLEKRILRLEREIVHGESTFVLNAWIRKKDSQQVRQLLDSVRSRVIIEEKDAAELERRVVPPTQFRNNRFFRPFETVIRLYGLPSYYEIDPTPFFAIVFCLMFGIMFGDIGQGLVYFIAGVSIRKKIPVAGQIFARLGGSSILFGFVYGSFFGLEHSELPWLPSLIGKPLDPVNIPLILIAGVVFGVVVLTISFIFGIINSLRRSDVESGIFGKNGAAGYVFFISLVLTAVSVTGVISIPVSIPAISLLVSLLLMLLKEPLASIVTGRRPFIHGSIGNYLTESIFEGIETVLGTLSNAISFIRVGAFALNHAGLFLAFLVMSEITNNIALKILILALGNVLILTLEGLVVFIQGLRLQYYEMFSKYFQGDGIAFKPVKLSNR